MAHTFQSDRCKLTVAERERDLLLASWGLVDGETVIAAGPNSLTVDKPDGSRRTISMPTIDELEAAERGLDEAIALLRVIKFGGPSSGSLGQELISRIDAFLSRQKGT